ncbi:RND family efflux transporter, MFP subunit [bacterium A37T11]|nr:RND family efflux transporter, MFP subunit [bacterium A37T11]
MDIRINQLIGIGCIALLVVACGGKDQKTSIIKEKRIPVKLLQLEPASATGGVVQVSGLFSTDDEATLSFKNGGVIERVLVKEGDAVKKGQLLATVHTAEINAAVQQAQLGLDKANRDYARASQLFRDSVATLEQMQNAKTAMEVAKAQLTAASVNQGYTAVRASTSGYVLRRLANEGQVVGPGTPVLMINGAGDSDWLLNTGVSDRQWAQIKVGDSATIQTDALQGQTLAAYVFRKSEGVDPASGTLQVQLKLKGKVPPAVASGIFGRASIHTSSKGQGWLIPMDALLDGDGGKGYVFTTTDKITAHKTEVMLGSIKPDGVLVTAGLEHAGSVIISGSPYLTDGSPIVVK